MLNRLRGAMTRIFTPVADRLLKAGVSPDAVTVTGTLVVVVTALWAFPTGNLLPGALIIALFTLTDSLDGVMARRAGRAGPWGAFLDSTLDRVADGAIFAGLVLWYVGDGDSFPLVVLALLCLVLGSIVPYARARAEGLGMVASGGIAERADRLFAVLIAAAAVGVGAPDVVLGVILVLLALASAVTVVQRMTMVHRQAVRAAE
ncbi:phosphatidylinositol phosphate synthase [Cellulomonas edaphi]|uniref:Phosphatidylinositol phosphate synthase n=1 Tax=Cellulomonas edaphi TaxID=3053468 RepID=A0ABT7S6P0_9CELL|nr:CDP-alcohol phosphatidyltransferase family protein [Cellulomons edaphi]MDM7831286.1 CDP-alcohol phosphatidyltransferase family protein [Cellulomons edaphi]